MQSQLEKEGEEDEEVYDKMVCWCETNDKENTQALDKATALRTKQLAEFNAEEKESLQGIASLKSAVNVLGKHNSFLQSSAGSDELTKIALMLNSQLRKNSVELTKSQRKAVVSFVQSPDDYYGSFAQQAPSA